VGEALYQQLLLIVYLFFAQIKMKNLNEMSSNPRRHIKFMRLLVFHARYLPVKDYIFPSREYFEGFVGYLEHFGDDGLEIRF